MTLAEIEAFVSARWRWIAGVLLAVVLVLGGTCYGHAQYDRGRSLARAEMADSISKAYEARYAALRDSVTREMAAFRTEVQTANARASDAEARATAAEAHARQVLTPQVIAQTPPQVLALLEAYRVSTDSLMASNRDLRVHLDTALAHESRFATTLELADSTIAHQRATIVDLQSAKEPPHGFWHTVGVVSEDVGLVLVGGVVTKAIF